ncbi:ferritin family protein (plasmid) [Mycolicibacterium aubagnense]|uniref:ferritin family protein n=1 Tax=Mycolicibacterium aubagnense TaxID=319707 RepID=UPI00244DDF8D|nr:ferritin family protein [Mycolicibacterium aubagnense]WGI36034.1 ferritin family protein [Mycolicibacterium aubagnense]
MRKFVVDRTGAFLSGAHLLPAVGHSRGVLTRCGKPLLAVTCIAVLLAPVTACSSDAAPQASSQLADSTRANALSAMHGEALAHAKYLSYAAQAQQSGRVRPAQEFTSASQTELSDHFAREADLVGLGGDVAANLRDAISGETNEVDTMYPGFAKQATADNNPAAAALFTNIAADEAAHLKGFTTALAAATGSGPAGTVPVGQPATPVAIAAGPARSSGPTLANLRTAMQGEAFAYAKYRRYADQARSSGNTAVAQLFTNTADIELNEHFAELAALAGLVSADTNVNLRDAIAGEQHEEDVMYPDYARQADQAGNAQAASLFREIAGDEKKHAQAFTDSLIAA